MYKQLQKTTADGAVLDLAEAVQRLSDNAFIPFDPANTDYQHFKADITEGAELQDSEGVVMSPEAAKEFVKELP